MSPRTTVHELTITLMGVEPLSGVASKCPAAPPCSGSMAISRPSWAGRTVISISLKSATSAMTRPIPDTSRCLATPPAMNADQDSVPLRKWAIGLYEYDFGDSWEHEIVVEQILAAGPGSATSRCLDRCKGVPARGRGWTVRLRGLPRGDGRPPPSRSRRHERIDRRTMGSGPLQPRRRERGPQDVGVRSLPLSRSDVHRGVE